MISQRFIPFFFAENFLGVNAKDTSENALPGEWSEESINIFSDPKGALACRPGYTSLTSASIGTSLAWCGFYQFDVHSAGVTTPHYIGGVEGGKLYEYISNGYTEIYSGLSNTNADDARFSFFTLNNQCIISNGLDNTLVYSGTGSCATFATSVTADWGLEWQRYGWLHSTLDPRLLYYCSTLGDPDSAYTSFLNFDKDEGALKGGCKSGDDMIIGKEFSMYRVQYRGTSPLFSLYRIPSKVGPVCHWVMKELPNGNIVFLAPDCNFYMLSGDSVIPVGDNIQPFIKKGVPSRLKYAVSGILYNRSQYWCSFTYTSGATQNDRTVVMDYSRPYTDKWGNNQYPWFIYSIGANCFAEVIVSGQTWLYHGGYVGKMYKNDTGSNDNGSSISPTYVSLIRSLGDPSLEKKFDNMTLNYARKGDWDLNIQLVFDSNASTEKTISENMLGGQGYQSLFDIAKFDEDYFSSESDRDTIREIGRTGKVFQIRLGTTGVDEDFLIYSYGLHAKPLRRTNRSRE